ncbi:cytochrome P450 3A14 [Trichonephila clavipes]|nr:cytochrome P450 3A14 [Trichonephila clavipes]
MKCCIKLPILDEGASVGDHDYQQMIPFLICYFSKVSLKKTFVFIHLSFGDFTKSTLIIAIEELLESEDVTFYHLFNNGNENSAISTGDEIFDKMMTSVTGEDWKRIRTIVIPTFSTGKIRRMINIFKECGETSVQNFKKASANGDSVELRRIFGGYTMDVIASSAFSTKIDSHNDPENKFVLTAREVFRISFNWRLIIMERHSEQLSQFERGRIIGMMEAGRSARRVARQLGRFDCAVRRCRDQWIREMSFTRRPGSGHPRQTSRREDHPIVKNALVHSTALSAAIQAQLVPSLGPPVSFQYIRRRLAEGHLGSRRSLRVLPLTSTHRRRRLEW